ncbi:MAG: hypothetical protein K5888_05420 [Lachnospiraceae bacterium]|nr:hypothetical protein [Lachnospiraceae bacterium]
MKKMISLISDSKKHIAVLIASVLAISALTPAGALFGYPTQAKAALGDIGEPRNAYNLGMAGILEGNIVVLSLFVDTPSDKWNVTLMKDTLKKLDMATEYLEKQAEDNDIELEFDYDWTKDRNLRYRIATDFEADDEAFEDKIDEVIGHQVNTRIDYQKIKESYGADGIFMMLYFNTEDRCYAIAYDGEDIPQETVLVYNNSDACEYAHEILHVFGAHDLYEGAEYTEDVVKYVKKTYPEEIMFDTGLKNGKIEKEISPITAYHIGWVDKISETSKYDQLKR